LVDAVPLESAAGRQFGELVDKFLAASCHDEVAAARLRSLFALWRDNDAKLQMLAQRSFLVKEVVASSQDLSALGSVGLSALDLLARGALATGDWKTQQLAILQQAEKPKAQLLLVTVPAVQRLVEAAASGGGCSSAK
jgi:hexosaminidase